MWNLVKEIDYPGPLPPLTDLFSSSKQRQQLYMPTQLILSRSGTAARRQD